MRRERARWSPFDEVLMKQSIYGLLGRGVFPTAVYCSPQSACEFGGVRYPNRITQQQYDLLAEAGVNLFFGQSEVVGTRTEKDVSAALDCAARAGAGYLARFSEALEYCSLGERGFPDYRKLSPAGRQSLDDRFARSLEKYANHSAFYGICFRDEPGTEMFRGIAAAKKIFEKVCGNKFFYLNMFPYYISAEHFEFGGPGVAQSTRKEFATDRTNIERYKTYVEEYLDVVAPEIFSYDAYPFLTLGEGAETGVHEVLYDIPGYLAELERKRGIPFWMFLQQGGRWEGDPTVRIPNSAEHRLQFNVALAYGVKGLQLFPGCYPNDWLHDNMCRAGLVDRLGNPTLFYAYFKREMRQVKLAGPELMGAERTGVMLSGDFYGLLPERSVLEKVPFQECIYQGKLPGNEVGRLFDHEPLSEIKATSQILTGCFEKGKQRLYYVVNNSVATSANAILEFSKEITGNIVRDGERSKFAGRTLRLPALQAGEGVLVSCDTEMKSEHAEG